MNKNGFTLIELIVTIGLMALIGLVIGTNMLGIFSNAQDKEYKDFKNKIEEAACMYVDTENGENGTSFLKNCYSSQTCRVTIKRLIDNGYIEEDLKNPSTGKKVMDESDKFVNITWDANNVKTCTLQK